MAAKVGGSIYSSFDPGSGAAVLHVEIGGGEELRLTLSSRIQAERIESAAAGLVNRLTR